MLIPDTNVLVHAVNGDSPQHARCHGWLAAALGGGEPVGLAWHTLLGFVRLATRAGAFSRPLHVGSALDVMDEWLAAPAATIVAPTERHASALRALLTPLGAGGNLTSDAHLAALAIEHGGVVVTLDRDFDRFSGLTWREP